MLMGIHLLAIFLAESGGQPVQTSLFPTNLWQDERNSGILSHLEADIDVLVAQLFEVLLET